MESLIRRFRHRSASLWTLPSAITSGQTTAPAAVAVNWAVRPHGMLPGPAPIKANLPVGRPAAAASHWDQSG
jgi:hypothetical protein